MDRPDVFTKQNISCQQCGFKMDDRWIWIGTILAAGTIQINATTTFVMNHNIAMYEGRGRLIESDSLQDRAVLPSGEFEIRILPADLC
jgi:hypothetical protein